MRKPLYEVVADELAELDVRHVFGLMGEETAKLTVAIEALPGLTYHGARQESAAVSMADGYARASGRLGVCLLSRGPGYTNGLTGLIAASKAGTPLLAIAGDTAETDDPSARLYPKHVDQTAIAHACGVRAHRLVDAAHAAAGVRAAAREALDGGGVVVVNVPTNLLETPVDSNGSLSSNGAGVEAAGVSLEDLDALARTLAGAERPLLLAGRGAAAPPTRTALVELAETTGALLATSLLAKDLFIGHPANIGVSGGFANDLTRAALADVDAVVAFGASLNAFTAGGGKLFADAHVCQVALAPRATGLRRPPGLVIEADAGATAGALLEELHRRGHVPAPGWNGMRDRIASYDRSSDFEDRSGPEGIDPRTLMCILNEALPKHRTLTIDGGHFSGFPASYLDVPGPGDFHFCLDYSAVGVGHGTALGVAVARPDATNVLVVGDGGLLMTLGELDTVTRCDLPLVIVVVNDAAYGAELHYLDLVGVPSDAALFPARDFAAVAAALGADAVTVRTADEARAAGLRAHELERPLLIDCHVNPAVRALWLEELFEGGTYGR